MDSLLYGRSIVLSTLKKCILNRVAFSTTVQLLEDMDRIKQSWDCYIERMNEEEELKTFFEWCLPGKRSLGRPKKRWV